MVEPNGTRYESYSAKYELMTKHGQECNAYVTLDSIPTVDVENVTPI